MRIGLAAIAFGPSGRVTAGRLALLRVAVAWVALVSLPGVARAHALAPSLLELHEHPGGRVEVVWKTPRAASPGASPEPVLPEHCEAVSPPTVRVEKTARIETWRIDCGVGGLIGAEAGVSGLLAGDPVALLRVVRPGEAAFQAVLRADAPRVRVPERTSRLGVVGTYLRLGAWHLASGLDHGLFILALLLLVRGGRALVATVTAFTLGHSVTLVAAALGLVRVPSAWVEVAIALTLVVLATEVVASARGQGTRLARRPWRIAFGFGLLHGLGFAAALGEVGLPRAEIPLALFAFNVGIEVGQLGLVALALLVARLGAPHTSAPRRTLGRLGLGYALGVAAAYWALERAGTAWVG